MKKRRKRRGKVQVARLHQPSPPELSSSEMPSHSESDSSRSASPSRASRPTSLSSPRESLWAVGLAGAARAAMSSGLKRASKCRLRSSCALTAASGSSSVDRDLRLPSSPGIVREVFCALNSYACQQMRYRRDGSGQQQTCSIRRASGWLKKFHGTSMAGWRRLSYRQAQRVTNSRDFP